MRTTGLVYWNLSNKLLLLSKSKHFSADEKMLHFDWTQSLQMLLLRHNCCCCCCCCCCQQNLLHFGKKIVNFFSCFFFKGKKTRDKWSSLSLKHDHTTKLLNCYRNLFGQQNCRRKMVSRFWISIFFSDDKKRRIGDDRRMEWKKLG